MLLKKFPVLAASVAAVVLASLTACSGGTASTAVPAATTSAPAGTSAPATSAAPAADFKLVSAGALTACADIPYPPFEYEDASSPNGYAGFDIDVMSAIATKLGLEYKVIDVEFNSLQSGTVLAAGQCDIGASAITITEERKANLDFSAPYYDSLQSLLVKTDSGVTKLADLAGKNIGVQAGTTGQNYAKKNAPADAKLIDFPSDGELWPAIQAGQIDAILQDQPVNHEHEVADAGYRIVETYNTDEQYGFAFDKGKKTELMTAVNEQLAAMRADGTYDTIYKKYFG
jgi:polar amino acid transport system substrate-binding protein